MEEKSAWHICVESPISRRHNLSFVSGPVGLTNSMTIYQLMGHRTRSRPAALGGFSPPILYTTAYEYILCPSPNSYATDGPPRWNRSGHRSCLSSSRYFDYRSREIAEPWRRINEFPGIDPNLFRR